MNLDAINQWISEHEPKGKEKLAAYAEISVAQVKKILRTGHEPGLDIAKRMAKAMNMSLDHLAKNTGVSNKVTR